MGRTCSFSKSSIAKREKFLPIRSLTLSWSFSEFCASGIAEGDARNCEARTILAKLHDHFVARRFRDERVFHIGFDSAGGELGGKRRRDFLEQSAVARSASVEKRHGPANLVGKFLVREPGEILEHHRQERSFLQLKGDRGRCLSRP